MVKFGIKDTYCGIVMHSLIKRYFQREIMKTFDCS